MPGDLLIQAPHDVLDLRMVKLQFVGLRGDRRRKQAHGEGTGQRPVEDLVFQRVLPGGRGHRVAGG